MSDCLAWTTHRGWGEEDLADLDADLVRVRSALSRTSKAIEALTGREGGGR